MRTLLALLFLAPFAFAADEKAPTPIEPAKLDRTAPIDYAKDVAPILTAHCLVCHSGKQIEGKYDMGSHAGLLKGGKRGAAITPGKPADSTFYTFSAHRAKPVMPPRSENNDLSSEELAILKAWIEQGAKGPAGSEIKVRPTVALALPPALVKPVRALVLRPNSTTLAVGRGTQVTLFDTKSGDKLAALLDPEIKTAAHLSLVEAMAIAPDGRTLATGSFREVKLWNLETRTLTKTLAGFADRVVTLAYSPDGKFLAAGGGAPTEDGEVKIFDAATGNLVADWKCPHTDTVFGLAFSPDGKLLATAGADKFVRLFEVPGGKLVKAFEGHTQHVLDVGFSPDGKRLASAGADDLVKIWDMEKGEKVRDLKGHTKQVTRLVFGKTGLFTIAGDGTLKSWRVDDGNAARSLGDGKDYIGAVAVSADGTLIVTGGEDGTVRLYVGPTATPTKVLAFEGK